jgi:RNA polymerase sigma-70 factor, ECF subfamily
MEDGKMDDRSAKLRFFESRTLGHMGRLHRFGVHLTGNAVDADDLVQETYLKAFRYWESCDPDTNVQAWLFRILKNSFINQYRKEVREGIIVEYAETTTPEHGAHPANAHALRNDPVFSDLLDDDVSVALSGLPDKCRTVLILCDIEGLTYDEIASFLDCPLGTVRSRLHRARKVLRSTLARYASEKGYGIQCARSGGELRRAVCA